MSTSTESTFSSHLNGAGQNRRPRFHERLLVSLKKRLNYFYQRQIRIDDKSLAFYTDKLSKSIPFSFSRFGDGEWSAIFNRKGANCDGHEFFPELGSRLGSCLLEPLPYIHGLQPLALKTEGRNIARFLKSNKVTIPWVNADVFHDANKAGLLSPLVNQLRRMQVVLVGPKHLKAIGSFIPLAGYIEVPSRNCFTKIDEIENALLQDARNSSERVYAISASMAAKVLIQDLYPALGGKHWLIDFGSLWDIYAGVKSRGVYTDRDWGPLIKANLGS